MKGITRLFLIAQKYTIPTNQSYQRSHIKKKHEYKYTIIENMYLLSIAYILIMCNTSIICKTHIYFNITRC